MTKNKWYRVLGFVMVPLGLFLTVAAFMSLGKPVNGIPWVKLGPVGLMSVIGGIGLLFLSDNIKPDPRSWKKVALLEGLMA